MDISWAHAYVYVRSFTHSFSHLFNIFQQADGNFLIIDFFLKASNRSNRCLHSHRKCCSFECNKFHFTNGEKKKEKEGEKRYKQAMTDNTGSEWDLKMKRERKRENREACL